MNINLKFLKKEKSFKKESIWLDISFYWGVAVLIMFIMTGIALVWGYFFFNNINTDSSGDLGGTSNQGQMIKKERIDKALEYFSLKKQKSDQILITPVSVVDPSI